MGNVSCCQPQAINTTVQEVMINCSDDDDPKLMQGIDLISLLQQQVDNNFFIDFKPEAGINPFIGISVQNLSSFYNFIKQIKLEDMQSESGKGSDNRNLQKENKINSQCETMLDEIKNALFYLKKNTKKNVKALNLNQTRTDSNFVNVPYFLPWIETEIQRVCVYVGQWKYQSRFFKANLPNGIGRLYINNEVWQGQIQLSIEKLQGFSLSNLQSIQLTLNNPQTTTRQKISILKNNLTFQLNGEGRKFTKDDEYSGQFKKGFLNGKGQYKNFKHQYSYEGNWTQNAKSGKGIQKTKTTKYEGEWKNNMKNGQGTLIFYISAQKEKQRLKQQKFFQELNENHAQYKNRKARVKIQMNLQQISDNQVRQTLTKGLPKYKGQQLLTFEGKNQSQWQMQGFPFLNKNFIESIKFQQSMKTNFIQMYVGQFLDDKFQGKGIYQWVKGNFYVGDWVDGKMQGLGKFFWKQGYVYYGEYRNDLKHGKGQMKWDPYKRHRGYWAFGKKHGYGEQIKIQLDSDKNLKVIIKAGLWKNNNLDQKDVYFMKSLRIQRDLNQIDYSGIMKHNYFFYHPQANLDDDQKFNIIQSEAKNYYKNPCQYCGRFIFKQEKASQRGLVEGLLGYEGKVIEEKKDWGDYEGPQSCNSCGEKLKQLEEAKLENKQPGKKPT